MQHKNIYGSGAQVLVIYHSTGLKVQAGPKVAKRQFSKMQAGTPYTEKGWESVQGGATNHDIRNKEHEKIKRNNWSR